MNKQVIVGREYVLLMSHSKPLIEREISSLTELSQLGISVPELSTSFEVTYGKEIFFAFLEQKISKKEGQNKILESKADSRTSISIATGKVFAEEILRLLNGETKTKYDIALGDCKSLFRRFYTGVTPVEQKQVAMKEKLGVLSEEERLRPTDSFLVGTDFYIPDFQLVFDYDSGHVFTIDPGDESADWRAKNQRDMICEIISVLESKFVDIQKITLTTA